MKKNTTAPVVITDTNGKVTTVHRKIAGASPSRASIPAVKAKSKKTAQEDMEAMCTELLEKAQSTEDARLIYRTKASFYKQDFEALTVLMRYEAGSIPRGADFTMQARDLLKECGTDPVGALSTEAIGAVCRMREALEICEDKANAGRAGDAASSFANRDALTLYLLEDLSRETLMVRAMEHGISDATKITYLDSEGISLALLDGAL